MNYVHTTCYVSDLERSLSFYRDLLGLPVLRRMQAGDAEIAFLGESGKPAIELICRGGKVPPPGGFSIGFRVNSLDEATRRLERAGYPLLRGPVMPGPAIRFSFFRDPDGIEVQLLEYSSHE